MKNYRKNFLLLAFSVAFGLIFAACVTTESGNKTGESSGSGANAYYVSTLAGSRSGFADGPGTSAKFNSISGIAVDGVGNVYVTDAIDMPGNLIRIRKVDSRGNVSTLAGGTIKGFADGRGTSAQFKAPQGIAVDSAGNVYVADTGNSRIRKIDSKGNVSTLAGKNLGNLVGNSSFSYPKDIAIDEAGNMYVAVDNMIAKIYSNGNVWSFAGSPYAKQGFADGQGTSVRFNWPQGVAVDSAGNVYVADTLNNRIRKIDSRENVSVLAGNEKQGFADGRGTSARFNHPSGVAVDKAGNVYVADSGNNRIRKIDSTGWVSTLAGTGKQDYVDGLATSASFFSARAVAVDKTGNVYVADVNRIRKITLGLSKSGSDEKPAGVKLGGFIGVIDGFEGGDIIVNGKDDTIARQAPMGRSLIVDANGQYIYLQSTFPMQTVVKCKVTSGDRSLIKKGMKVYLKP